MRSFHIAEIKKSLFKIQIFPIFYPRGHLMDYHLPNMDNRGHLANYHLPHFVHVVIEQPHGHWSVVRKRRWTSSDRSAFTRVVSNLALNFSWVLPNVGRGKIRTVVGIFVFVRPSFFVVDEWLLCMFWFFGGVTRLGSGISLMLVQQGLEIRGFWFQKKTVQLKTALREVYTYVLKGIFFQKTV